MGARTVKPEGRAIAALRLVDPVAWHRKVRAALKRAGSVPGAADALGITTNNLHKWLRAEPSLREGIELPERGGPRRED